MAINKDFNDYNEHSEKIELEFDDEFFSSVRQYFDEDQCYFRFYDTNNNFTSIPINHFVGKKISPSDPDTLSLAVKPHIGIEGEESYGYDFIGKLKNNVILYGLSVEKDWNYRYNWQEIIKHDGTISISSSTDSRDESIDRLWTDNTYVQNAYGDKDTYIQKYWCYFTYASFDGESNNTSNMIQAEIMPSIKTCTSSTTEDSFYYDEDSHEYALGKIYEYTENNAIRKHTFLGYNTTYNLTCEDSRMLKRICGCCDYNPFNEEYNNDGYGQPLSVEDNTTYPTIDIYVETDDSAFQKLNDYCFMTYDDYDEELTSYYRHMFECFDKNHLNKKIRCTTLGHKSWPSLHLSDKRVFLYGIGKKFLLCDLNGHMLTSATLSDNTNISLLFNNSALSSLDTKFIIKNNVDLLTKDQKPYFMDISKGEDSMLWQHIADRTLFPQSNVKIDSLISNYNEYELGFHGETINEPEFNNLYFEDIHSPDSYNIQQESPFITFNEYMDDFAAVIQASSYRDLKNKLKNIIVQHPQLKFAGFININDASYLYSSSEIAANKSIFDDDINFIACTDTVTRAINKKEFYRPYHAIFLPVFFINSTIVMNVLGDESLRSIHNEKCNALTSLISALYPYSNESRIDNVYFYNSWFDQNSAPSALMYGIQQYPSTISASTVAEFKDAITSASIYSNVVYNINCNTTKNGKVRLGNMQTSSNNFVRLLKAAATNATCFVTGQNAAKSLMLNPTSQNNREYVFLADTKSNESKSSFFYMVDSSGISRQQKLLSDKPFSLHVLNDYFNTNDNVPILKNIYNNCNVEHIFKKLIKIFQYVIYSDNRLQNFISAYFHKKIILKLYDNENSNELNDNYEKFEIDVCLNENYRYDCIQYSQYKEIGWYYTYLLSHDLANDMNDCLSLIKLFISFIGLSNICPNGYASTFKAYFLSFADRLAQYNSSSTLYYDFYETFNIHDTLNLNEIFIEFCENNCCNQFNNELKTIYQAAIHGFLTTNDTANYFYLNNIENNKLEQKLIAYDFSEQEVDDIITQTRNAYENVFRILLNMAFNMYLYVNDLQEMMPNVMNKLNNSEKFDLIFNIILQNAPHCGFLSKTKYTDDKVFLVE